jgi:hypothetical protein
MIKILPSITSLSKAESTWLTKIDEIKLLELRSIALFVTGLSMEERQECFQKLLELRKNYFFEIPFVHAVSNMPESDYEFLINNFQTKSFNLHPLREFPLRHKLSDHLKNLIYIENASSDLLLYKEDLNGFAGICFDLSHLDDLRRRSLTDYSSQVDLSNNFKVGANHISAVGHDYIKLENKIIFGSKHYLSNISELNYLSDLPVNAISNIIAVELENSLAEQLTLIDKIWKTLPQNRNNNATLAA